MILFFDFPFPVTGLVFETVLSLPVLPSVLLTLSTLCIRELFAAAAQ